MNFSGAALILFQSTEQPSESQTSQPEWNTAFELLTSLYLVVQCLSINRKLLKLHQTSVIYYGDHARCVVSIPIFHSNFKYQPNRSDQVIMKEETFGCSEMQLAPNSKPSPFLGHLSRNHVIVVLPF